MKQLPNSSAEFRASALVVVMDMEPKTRSQMTRRELFRLAAPSIGVAALTPLLWPMRALGEGIGINPGSGILGLPGLPHFPPKAKRVIFLFQSGGPSQVELFEYKPKLRALHGTQLPESIRQGPPLVGMAARESYTVVAPPFEFKQVGKSGVWISELLPHTASIVDDIAIVRTVRTEAVNHDPGTTFMQTGFAIAGRPSLGAWVTYGLGSKNPNMPGFVVLISKPPWNVPVSLSNRYWSTGFMPSKYQGVSFRAATDPVAYLSDPPGIDRATQRRILDDLAKLNQMAYDTHGDPEIETRIAQYETAYRMQTSVPELADLSKEPDSTFELYGPDARKPGSYAANCLLARRLAERDVRFIQLYHRGWDHHNELPRDIKRMATLVDQPSAALIKDLKQRGLLEDTLVIWAGEFGRTVYSEGKLKENFGRDHHGRCFTVWMAGGGIKPGASYGETDDFSFNVARDPVHVHDLHATILHCLGIDHTKLTYKFQGRQFRLTDVAGEVVQKILV
jgi:hypothetical protein